MSAAELEEKQKQLDDLQKSFNEYVESSKELEAELEAALEDAAEKLDRSAEKEAAAERRAKELQAKVDELTKSLSNKPSFKDLKSVDNEELLIKFRRLENENEDMHNQVRILEASIEDLNHKVHSLEEDTVFLKTDIEALTLERNELEEEMNSAVSALEKKLEISENDRRKLSADIADMTAKVMEQTDSHDVNDDKVQMLLFKQDKGIDFIKATLDALAIENAESHRHGHGHHHDHVWQERVEELRTKLQVTETHRHELTEEVYELRKQLEQTALTQAQSQAQDHYPREAVQQLEDAYRESEQERAQLVEDLRDLERQLEEARQSQQDQVPSEMVAALQEKLRDRDAMAKELAAQIETLQAHLEAVLVEAQAAEELRAQAVQQQETLAQQQEELSRLQEEQQHQDEQAQVQQEQLQQSLEEVQRLQDEAHRQQLELAQQEEEVQQLRNQVRDLEAAKYDLEQTLREKEEAGPKIERVGNFLSGWEVSSLSQVNTSSVEISTVSTTQVTVTEVIKSGDKELMKAELLRLAKQYDAMRQSNTRLLNKLQALQGNIQVCCRTRPPSYQELGQGGKVCIDAADDTELMCYDGRSEAWKSFFFDRVWRADASQADVFADIEPMVISVLDGYNACILAYGQTGSGKTFTMDGYGDQYGANYRTIQKLFDLLILRKVQAEAHAARVEQLARETAARDGAASKLAADRLKCRASAINGQATSNSGSGAAGAPSNASDETDDTNSAESGEEEAPFSFSLTVSMLEIYNEQVYDLLSNGGGQSVGGSALDIRLGPDNSVNVPGLQQMPVHSLQDVMSVFAKGSANRATASTNLNEHSSRSHLIVQVDVTTQRGSDMAVRGRLYLVDLAGSERVGKSGATGATMKEAQHINKSLSALGDVMEALDQKSKHVPYRNSKLTYLLQNSLGGNSRTMMIVTVCPTDLTFEESLFTLQFATRVRNIAVGPAQKQSNAKNLEATMKALKAELKEAKVAKAGLEEQILNLKKEQKKVPQSSLMEAKLKTIEEARKAGEILMQQLNRQITECNVKLADEKEAKEQLSNELAMAQKNLKKALEQIKELTKANERLEAQLKRRETDLDSASHGGHRGSGEDSIEARPLPTETPAASTRPPPAPSSAPSRGINSSARRVLPTSTGSSLSGPVRKTRPSALKEFMLPTASSVAYVAASLAEHEAHSEAVVSATHGPLNPTLVVPPPPPTPKQSAPSPGLMRRPSISTINTSDLCSVGEYSESGLNPPMTRRLSSLQDIMAPTAARKAYINAAEAEQAAKAEMAKSATHAGFTRLSTSPARRDGDDGGSVATANRPTAAADFVNPKGHSTWQDAMVPTAARMAALAATEQEYTARSRERAQGTHPPGPRFSVSPAGSRGRNDDESMNSARLGSDYVHPKGHNSWEDALAPTAARKAALAAQEEEYARKAKEAAEATHSVKHGRFSLSPTRSRWEGDEDSASKPSASSEYNKHRNWEDITAPTASFLASVGTKDTAQSPPASGIKPWVPSSKEPGRPPQPPASEPGTLPPERRTSISSGNGSAAGGSSSVRDSSASRRASAIAATSSSVAAASSAAAAATGGATSSRRSSTGTGGAATPGSTTSVSSVSRTVSQSQSESQSHTSLLQSSSMVRRSATATDPNTGIRMTTLSMRSEEAMKRHQLRMDKRREMTAKASAGVASHDMAFSR